ncbi:MAG: GDSL-type esterase/lipase family protein [Planctomycetes bacterium]|nr:GDSL-type esterase/lipase family protein [Planctomycetota bacterium]
MSWVFLFVATATALAEVQPWVEYPGGNGPGQGKHIVFLTGDEEYRSEEGLPMLAKILSERHGFRCTVLFAVDPKTGHIDPNNKSSLPGSKALDTADAIVMLVRHRTWPEEAMSPFIKAYEAGKPIIGLRTSTHPFQFEEGSPYHGYNKFGENVLGEEWVSHWGRHKEEATLGVTDPAAKGNPILRGVTDVFGDTDVYEAYPPADSKILLRGAVLTGMTPDTPAANYRKKRASDGAEQGVNEPQMPIAWTRLHKNPAGKTNRVFCTTMGAATDLRSEGLRRLLVNAVFWGLGMDVHEKVNVDLVGSFEPSAYGFDGYRRGVRPSDLVLQPKAAASSLPLRFTPHERIALVGNSLAERMNLYGHFEALLHGRFPQHELIVRNFARPCDAVDNRQRPSNYTVIDDPLNEFHPDTFLCFFGFNESFAGEAGESQFRAAYEKYLDETASQYRRADGGAPRFVLVSPIAFEPTGNPLWPDAAERNANLLRYTAIVAELARKHGLAYVDLFAPTEPLFAGEPGMQFTINGCHLDEAGDREVALLLDSALFGNTTPANLESQSFERLRAAVDDKSWVHLQDYRMLNGWYVYGGRRTFDTETFPKEYKKIRAMAELRDRYIWDLAQGKSPTPPDDSTTGELLVPPTRFGVPTQDYSEPEELRYLTPEQSIAAMKVPENFEVQLFASEREFPELAKPNQLNFDNRGRLWVSCMPTYPQWKPGDPRPSDRLLIFEDSDRDGRADKCKVFYDKLHCPTGFEFWNGGVLVVDQPRLIWIKDTDGDDRADLVVELLDGWASDDTHHTIGAFEFSHGGLLHMLEGIAMSTTVETPWGPHRRQDASGAHVLDPRTLKLRHIDTPGYGNPWCYLFDSWGNGIVGDGTTAQQHWDSPLSGEEVSGRRGMDPIFDTQGMRPVVGSEFLLSRHLPDDVQGQFIYACVINMNGLPRWEIHDESAGMRGHRVMHPNIKPRPVVAATSAANPKEIPDDLLASTDKAFRPVDPQIGPDGALWFGDWCNALIGHMQYSQRDPNRDHVRGRIFRLVDKKRPLLELVTQFDKSEAELLEQFREYEPRTRYRARRELYARPTEAVLAAVKEWIAGLNSRDPEYDRLRCEALWVQQSHHSVDRELLQSVLKDKTPAARAAATHIVADEREYLPTAQELLAAQVNDEHPRVRLEAIRGLSFFPNMDAVNSALKVFDSPLDSWLTYTLEHTLVALEPVWTEAYTAGTLSAGNGEAQEFIERMLSSRRPGLVAETHLKVLLNPDTNDSARLRGYIGLEPLRGNAENGQAVFRRVCASCHKIGDVGFNFGPDQSDVGKRLSRREIMESIIEPSKKVDPKYVATTVITTDGKTEIGLVVEKNEDAIVLVVADGKQKKIPRDEIDELIETKQSSMPENLASTLAPAEFLDVVEYLTTQR